MIVYQKKEQMQKYNYDVLGIGNAVTDIFVEVDRILLKKII